MDSSLAETPETGLAVPPRRSPVTVLLAAVIACGPAAITAYLAFRSGGFFAGAPAIVAVVLGVALVLRLTLAEAPFEGFGAPMVTATVALGAFTLFTLISALWSHAPAQALIAFDRSLMYWLALVLFGSFGWSHERLVWAVRVLAATITAIAVLALITRLLPGIHSIPATLENYRLSYPLTYWNALGIFASVGIVLCAGLATDRDESPMIQASAAAAVPILVATVYFTFSRGGIGALLLGTVAFVALALRRELVTAGVAIIPPALVAVLLCVGTTALSTGHYLDPTGVSEGKTLAWELIGCALAAGVLRFALRPLDRRLAAIEISAETRRRAWIGTVGALVAAAVVVGIAVDAPQKISDGFESFTESKAPVDPNQLQDRLTELNSNGRVVAWELALDTFGKHPAGGTGSGTFARTWAKEGSGESKLVNAHSLYLETMSELGVPGLVFLLIAVGAILVGLAMRIRGPDRVLYASLFAAGLAWCIHAGFDWDWQMPATGFFLFGVGGMAIAARREDAPTWQPWSPGRMQRVALGIGCLVLVATPALMAISQGYLDASVRKFQAGDCGGAAGDALDAIHVLSVRPEPYQVLGFCDARAGEGKLAVTLLETAVNRDKGEWESYYGLALVKAVAGQDPRPAARTAFELAPGEPLAQEGIRMFKTGGPEIWKRRALNARLPFS